jgi:hypothetical protein
MVELSNDKINLIAHFLFHYLSSYFLVTQITSNLDPIKICVKLRKLYYYLFSSKIVIEKVF